MGCKCANSNEDEEEINKKGLEDGNDENIKDNKEDRLSSFIKIKNNNIKKRNISNDLKKYDTFNKIHNSSIILNKDNTKSFNDIHKNSTKKNEIIENNKVLNQNIKNETNIKK